MSVEENAIENAFGGELVYARCKCGGIMTAAIKRYRGNAQRVVIPPEIDGMSVTSVERKAFLSCKSVQHIELPDTIREIGDWAFAHAEQLRSIRIPHHHLTRGKELFLGCGRLHEIVPYSQDEHEMCVSAGLYEMLATAVRALHDYFLFDPVDFGSDAWVRRWDEKLLALLDIDDLDGFAELWTCGEEDYEGKDYDIESYPVEKRKMKLRIVYFRLMHPYKADDGVVTALREYISRHTKGTDKPQSWELIMEEHKNELEYYRTFAEAGGINELNFDGLLVDMEGVDAEIKAFMLRYKEEHFSTSDAFAAFELKW